jgi:hypothetical protein
MSIHHYTFEQIHKICEKKEGKWLLERVEQAAAEKEVDKELGYCMKKLAAVILKELNIEHRYDKIKDLSDILWIIAHPDKK